MISGENSDLQKRVKSARNDDYMGKYKLCFSLNLFERQINIFVFESKNIKNVLWGL